MKATPLTNEAGPRRCSVDPSVYCPDHEKMLRSRAVGMATVGVIKWAVPLLLAVLAAILGFLYNDVRTVEAKFDRSSIRHDEVHEMVHNIDFNLRRLFYELDIEYIDGEE